ncbi:ataxin-10 [Condylostylus longicornis]|uniref:ataxin-10 n=1 Tax=Condylostylus longicornis TaxID=2530218 RepID=UPI00244E5918|nr:ataxin-10 [Condylostylus longicornis]
MNENNITELKEMVSEAQKYLLDLIYFCASGKEMSNAFSVQDVISFLKRLRNSCCKGYESQCEVMNIIPTIFALLEKEIFSFFEDISSDEVDQLNTLIWQLMANLTVNNPSNQQLIWEGYGSKVKEYLNGLSPYTDIQLLILYNVAKGNSVYLDQKDVFEILLKVWTNILEKKYDRNLEFLHIFFEEYLCNISCRIVPIYATLHAEHRIAVLKYIIIYVRNGSPNGQIQKVLMEFISKEFKKKSDCILRVNSERINEIYPYEVLILLETISVASGDALYSHIYEKDHSLFLNVGQLLYTVNETGKQSNNIFTPMEKLTEVAPNSGINTDFQNEISYQLRTLLVRTLANLLYKNKKNQEYVRELNIIAAILDSTRPDARNPMIKEWSILAIRNMCENCSENQQIISNLTKVGDASKNVLTELNLEMGSLRISPKE